MPLWWWFVDALAVLAVLSLLVLVLIVIRRRSLGRSVGAFEMSVKRKPEASPAGWTLGVAVYGATDVEWYRTFSLAWHPTLRLPRGAVRIDGRRIPEGTEAHVLHPGHVVVTCEAGGVERQLALSPTALTGLLAWLESSPPGHGVNRVL